MVVDRAHRILLRRAEQDASAFPVSTGPTSRISFTRQGTAAALQRLASALTIELT
ncbi:MAG TPA: hypothetical protein VFY98_04860 [Intrasporangium sp.]|nr:hypothetical protein [Intrasporangium sp.]